MSHSAPPRRFPAIPRPHGLTLQLFLLIILPLTALLLVVVFGSLSLHGQAMRRLVSERGERAARAGAAALAEGLDHRVAAVRGLAVHYAASAPGEAALAGYAFLHPVFEGGLALFAPDGALLAASGAPGDWSARPLSDLLAQAAGSSRPAFSPVFSDPASGQALALVAASAPGGPVAVGAFSPAGLAARTLADLTSTDGLPVTYLVDGAGQLLYHAGAASPEEELARHPGVAEALQGQSGALLRQAGASEHVVAFSPVAQTGWTLVIEEPWQKVEDPLLRRTQLAPLIMLPIVLFALVVLGFGIRQIVQPLRRLEQKAGELAWGDYQAIQAPVGGISEIRRLQEALILMVNKVRLSQQGLRGYVGAITAGQEEERRRLARELHDSTIQSLIALNQRVQLARAAGGDRSPAVLAGLQEMLGQTIVEVRRFVGALRPVYLEDLGLAPALEALARETEAAAGLPVAFDISGPERRLRPEVELALYRMAQQALANVARHARASRAAVRLTFDSGSVTLSVRDDGQGFLVPDSPAEFAPRGHFGLLGLQERAELIGGRLAVRSAPGAGATVEVRAPT